MNYVLRTSKDVYYNFFQQGSAMKVIIYDEFTIEQCIIDNISVFSVDMDLEDNIYITYLTLNGDLKYCRYPQCENSFILQNINMHNSDISSLRIRVLFPYIHILYVLSDKTDTKYIIYDYCYRGSSWTNMKVCEATSCNWDLPLAVDKNNLSLYLAYENNGICCIQCFNPAIFTWNTFVNKLPLNGTHNVSIACNSKGDILSTFSEINCTYNLLLSKYKRSISNETSFFKESEKTFNFHYTPISTTLSLKNKIYIFVECKDTIFYSLYDESTGRFSDMSLLCSKTPSIFYGFFRSNFPCDKELNIEKTIIETGRYPYPILFALPPQSTRSTSKNELFSKEKNIEKLERLIYSLYSENLAKDARIKELERALALSKNDWTILK